MAGISIAAPEEIAYNNGCTDRERSWDRKPELTVILPVYNNGDFLYFRAFASLLRL
ncbi:MAG: hypothetical protein VZR11_12740 [Succinimonas sp.]|nr:hypothetical protein [Succinimonas sp.]